MTECWRWIPIDASETEDIDVKSISDVRKSSPFVKQLMFFRQKSSPFLVCDFSEHLWCRRVISVLAGVAVLHPEGANGSWLAFSFAAHAWISCTSRCTAS
jgi:hypothetical protein